MEWTDTLMLETSASQAAVRRGSVMEHTRVVVLPGVTCLCVDTTSRDETAEALALLRDFRATGRRMVLCDTTRMVVGRQFGHEVVETGCAQLLISCGLSGREVGIGARDAGLDLASVVVCGHPLAGGQVLANQLLPGDTVLLLGVNPAECEQVIALLEQRLTVRSRMAA